MTVARHLKQARSVGGVCLAIVAAAAVSYFSSLSDAAQAEPTDVAPLAVEAGVQGVPPSPTAIASPHAAPLTGPGGGTCTDTRGDGYDGLQTPITSNVCCHVGCIFCGGSGCANQGLGWQCCKTEIRDSGRFCGKPAGYYHAGPCILQ